MSGERKVFLLIFSVIFVLIIGVFLISRNSRTNSSNNETIEEKHMPEALVIAGGEWKPYVSKELPEHGFTTEIVKRAFEVSEVKVKVEFYSWPRALKVVQAHKAFGTYPWYFKEYRRETYKFSEPFIKTEEKLIYMKGNSKIPASYHSLDELKHLKFGGLKDYSHIKILRENGIEVDVSIEDINAIKKLYNGRIDTFPINPTVAMYIIRHEYPEEVDQFAFMERPLDPLDVMGLIVDKNYPEAEKYLEAFNSGLKTMKASGEYDKILEKYKIDLKYGVE